MTTKHVLVGERINPSGQQVRKKIKASRTITGFKMKPGYLYTVVRAISARVNQNYDGWPSHELKQAYHTFLGKPVFVNHENFDPNKARGVVVASRYIENGADKYIEVVQEIDAKRFPLLAHEIKTGGLDSVSMGAEAGFTICSACGNKAYDEPDMCDHVKFHKGEKVYVHNRKTGKTEERLVYESCHKLSFFELSYVFDPADETAVASKVLVASKHVHGADCAPGDPNCKGWNQSIKTSPAAPDMSGEVSTNAVPTQSAQSGSAVNPGGGGVPLVQNPDGSWTSSDPAWAHLIDRESGGQNIIQSPSTQDVNSGGNEAYGLFQITPGTWSAHGGQGSVYDSTPQQQADVAANIIRSNPSGSDWGAGLEGREDAAALASGVGGQPKAASKAMVRQAILNKLADATDDYLEWAKKVDSGEIVPERETGPAIGGGPSRSQQQWLQKTKKRLGASFDYPPNENSQKTQVRNTGGTYDKAHAHFDAAGAPQGKILDYGAGLGHSSQYGDTFEPHPRPDFAPTHTESEDIPDGSYHRVTNLNVLNVVPPEIRDHIVKDIGRVMAPGGHAVITTRGRDVMDAKGTPGPEPMSMVVGQGPNARYQKGFTRPELHQYVQKTLGPGYHVQPVPLGPAGVHVVRKAGVTANLRSLVRTAALKKLGWGETEAPQAVDTLREEGTAPEDDNDDFHEYVKPPEDDTQDFANPIDSPQDLKMPNLDEAAQLDREQEEQGIDMEQSEPGPGQPGQPGGQDEGNFITLKLPMPPQQQPQAPGVPPAPPQPQVPMQAFASRVGALQTLAFFERYYGHKIADWRDAIEAGRDLNPEEEADFVRHATLLTLENSASDSTTSRTTVKGTANMARSTLATRRKTAGTQHFAEGPYTDGGDVSRNDQGEQEEAFITETPAPDSTDLPDDDATNISNTEDNLVADEEYAHSLTARMARQKAELEKTAREYARVAGRRRTAEEYAGGPTAEEVDPELPTQSANELAGDNFTSADPNPAKDTSPGGDGGTTLPTHESSLAAFKAFDTWLRSSTKKSSREHSEVNIKRAAKQFADYNGIPVTAMFPALGIALRQARKNEAAKKGKNMRKRAVDLDTAAPDERVSVPTPVADTTDQEAQASQFHEDGFANNAGDDLADPDQSTGQNFAPGQAPSKSAKKADGILAIRCAEAMIAAGLEPNTRERKYQLANEFAKMNRGLILDRVALAERFAMVRQADRQRYSKVASGSTRGANQSPIPAGMGQGGSPRPQQRVAANSPDNDALLFG